MADGYPRLLGDVGATHARWAWQAAPGAALPAERTYRCDDFQSLAALIARFLADEGVAHPRSVAFGIATPIDGDRVAMTNRAWTFSIDDLQASLGAERCLVLNDFAALAAGVSGLHESDLQRIGGAQALAVEGAPRVVLGPGSGLGVAALVRDDGGREIVVAGEGGHASLAPGDAREAALLERLRGEYGHVSAERVLSGPGLVNMYRALCAIDGRVADASLVPADVTARALAGSDPSCIEAVQRFAGLLGSVAGNLALTFGARGGVYIAGGIVPKLGVAFDAALLRERFEAKGRFRGYLERIPVWLVTAPGTALLGAARALDRRG